MNDQVTQMFQQPGGMEAFHTAQQIARTLKSQRTQEMTAPVISTLTNLGNQYKTAQTDEQRQGYTRQASQVRGNYLSGGGSPMDLPSNLWGNDPSRGYETSEGFQAPITGYEGFGRTTSIGLQRQAKMDALKRRLDEAGLTGIDPWTGKETADQAYRMRALESRLSGGGGGGGLTPYQEYQIWAAQDEEQKAAMGYHGQAVDKYLTSGDINGAVKYLNSQYGRGLISADQYNVLIGEVSGAEQGMQNSQAAGGGLFERLAYSLYGPSIYGK